MRESVRGGVSRSVMPRRVRGESGEGKGDSSRSRSHSAHTFLTLPLTLPLTPLLTLFCCKTQSKKCEKSVSGSVSGSVRESMRGGVSRSVMPRRVRGERGEGKGDSSRSRSHSAHTFLTLPLTPLLTLFCCKTQQIV